jgi:hypothetical protein
VTCDANCTAATCGDATVNVTRGEQCDFGAPTAACNATCQNVVLPTLTFEGVFNTTTGTPQRAAVLGWNAATRTLSWAGHLQVRAGMTLDGNGGERAQRGRPPGNVTIAGIINAAGGAGATITLPLSLRAAGGRWPGPGGGAGGTGGDEFNFSTASVNALGCRHGSRWRRR